MDSINDTNLYSEGNTYEAMMTTTMGVPQAEYLGTEVSGVQEPLL